MLLTFEIRENNKKLHQVTEDLLLNFLFPNGSLSLKHVRLYVEYLAQLFQFLEPLLDKLSDDKYEDGIPATLNWMNELKRTSAIEQDFVQLDKMVRLDLNPLQERIIQLNLDYLSKCDVPQLIAHAYIHYMSLLSGGQILIQLFQRDNPQFPISIFTFENSACSSIEILKTQFVDWINDYGDCISLNSRNAFVHETRLSFHFLNLFLEADSFYHVVSKL